MWLKKIQEAIDYIEANLFEPITIESVGNRMNYSLSSFSNLFSAVTGYSIGEYIRFRRLSSAAKLLEKGAVSVTEMALQCGYETTESFSKAFRRMFGCSPSQCIKEGVTFPVFAPIQVEFEISGGFSMRRNLIPNVDKFDWSDRNRQSEYVNSVVSALNALGENLTYDYVCAVSGSAFRTSFSMKTYCEFNHGNYHVINTPDIIEHTFRVLGYEISHYVRGDFNRDCKIIMDSIDKGFPVITLEGVIDCSDACIITGYDNDGQVLLGYNPFMDVEDDHKEVHDSTGYFRKSGWHEGFFEKENGHIIVIHGKCEKPDEERIFEETLELVAKLIRKENMAVGQYNGLLAHRQFAEALMTYEWEDNFEPYLNVMCNYKHIWTGSMPWNS